MDEPILLTESKRKKILSSPFLLLFSVFVVATCGLIYELVAGTLASYLLGDSVTQFSTIIGVYLFSMGIGSYFSRFFNRNLLGWFIQIEILVGVVGGFSSSLLFVLFEQVHSFRLVLYALVVITGTLVGLEIPLLMRILQTRFEFKDLVSKVFTYDYIGALLASIIFPLLLIPYLGILKTSILFGVFNVVVAWVLCSYFSREVKWAAYLQFSAFVAILFLLAGFVYADRIIGFAESMAYQDKVIYARSTPYQRIVLTKSGKDIRLFLNGNLQFASTDEYRYHEALVHPALQAIPGASSVLIMGGGDGLALREVLKYPQVKEITLVDLDPGMTDLFSHHPMLLLLNDSAILSPLVQLINTDAFVWLKSNKKKFDCVIIDFPDPSNYSIGKLYTNAFYKLLYRALSDKGIAVIQSTSPFVAPKSFWCVQQTLQSTGFITCPYHALVPSFGDWGYVMALKNHPYQIPDTFNQQLRFINRETVQQLLAFPKDMPSVQAEVNKLNNQVLVHYFEQEWSKFTQ